MVKERNLYLHLWRRVHALHEASRRGGEADIEASARARYFESHAKLLAAADGDATLHETLRNADTSLPQGILPQDDPPVSNYTNPSRSAYRSGIKAAEQWAIAAAQKSESLLEIGGVSLLSDVYLELSRINPNGTERDTYRLSKDALLDLTSLFHTLPDNHYRVSIIDISDNSKRLVLEAHVRRGRMIDPADDSEGGRDRPPF
jgi:hypothetical protein